MVANLSTEHSFFHCAAESKSCFRTKVWGQLTSNPAGFLSMFLPEVGPLIMCHK